MKKIIITQNPQARNYKITQILEAGLVLQGWEVKSIRLFKASLRGSSVILGQNGAWLEGMKLQPYRYARVTKEMQLQSRPLLLKKKEILYLATKVKEGYFLVPLRLYWKEKKIKLEIGIGRKLKRWQKKEKIKNKDLRRQSQRDLADFISRNRG